MSHFRKSAILRPSSTSKALRRAKQTINFSKSISRQLIINFSRTSRSPAEVIDTAVRQELGLQSNKIPEDNFRRVVQSIKKSTFRATVGEIAAASGLKISEAEEALKALAFDSQANLQV
jgi:hypothetical protein